MSRDHDDCRSTSFHPRMAETWSRGEQNSYAAWVGFKTICTVALVGGFVYVMVSH
jgi:hypothetical protein